MQSVDFEAFTEPKDQVPIHLRQFCFTKENAALMAQKSHEARAAQSPQPKIAQESNQPAPNPIEDMVREQARTMTKEIEGVTRLLSYALKGQMVIGTDDDGKYILAQPKDIQALVKSKIDLVDRLFVAIGHERPGVRKSSSKDSKRDTVKPPPE